MKTTAFRVLVVAMCARFSVWVVAKIQSMVRETGFFGLYYQARCAVEHKDAHDPGTVLREFEGDGWKLPIGACS